ncbi:MAG: ATP-dependent Clp protease ATP-binding subunit [Cyanobacteria bacterium]|nr:ATP-dependent Clp protease ATP-binding subunit [Cyanobacteriota bacterium]
MRLYELTPQHLNKNSTAKNKIANTPSVLPTETFSQGGLSSQEASSSFQAVGLFQKYQVPLKSKALSLTFGNNQSFSVDPKVLHPFIQKGIQEAFKNARGFVTLEHLLLALLKDEEAGRELRKILAKQYKVVPSKLEALLTTYVAQVDETTRNTGGSSERKTPLNDADFADVFKTISEVSKRLEGDTKIDLNIFMKTVLMAENTRSAKMIRQLSPLSKIDPNAEEEEKSPLEEFTRDITFDYDMGDLYPVIGRENETRKVINILAQDKKANPILVGDPGVGKTAIVEKMAELLSKGEIPESLQRRDQEGRLQYDPANSKKRIGKRLLEIKWELIEAAAGGNPGKFKALVGALLDEAIEKEGEVLLFVDEIHKINEQFSQTKSADQLKPPLARGKIRLIGATTNDEYRQKFEKDMALVRRFSKVQVDEPTVEEAMTMMRGVRGRMEKKHGVIIRDDAIEQAVKKAKRYLADRKLPDSCTEILDASCATLKNEFDIGRFKNQSIQGEISQLQIDIREGLEKRKSQYNGDLDQAKDAVKKYTSSFSEQVLSAIEKAAKQKDSTSSGIEPFLIEKYNGRALSSWTVEKTLKMAALKQTPTNGIEEKLVALAQQNFSTETGKLLNLLKEEEGKTKHLNDLEKEIGDKKNKIEKLQLALKDEKILKTVTIEDILRTIEDKSGIPLAKLQESDIEKFTRMEQEIGKNLIGQGRAVSSIAAAIKNNKSGLSDPNKPIGSFLFLGPTGTGKTELAKVLAKFLFDDEKAIVRFDMSEFAEKHNVARLVGSPPGYIGYEEGGKLTNAMKENPYRIVLFDEIEKAHPDAYNIFLQILDDGRLTSGKGETVSFKDSIIIMTSNIGSAKLMAPFKGTDGKIDPASPEFDRRYRDLTRIAVNNLEADPRIKPEFRNRFDDIIAFHPLMRKHIEKIVDIQVKKLNGQLSQTEQKVSVKLDPSAKQYLVDMGSDFELGARPINRFITQNIKKYISVGLLKKVYTPGEEIVITRDVLEKWQKESDTGNKA